MKSSIAGGVDYMVNDFTMVYKPYIC